MNKAKKPSKTFHGTACFNARRKPLRRNRVKRQFIYLFQNKIGFCPSEGFKSFIVSRKYMQHDMKKEFDIPIEKFEMPPGIKITELLRLNCIQILDKE